MNTLKASLLAAAVLAAAPLAAQAESGFDVGATPSVSADLNFRITIPRILFLQVGTLNSIDEVVFDMTNNAQAVGDRSPVSGDGGDRDNGRVTARLRGNIGDVSLTVSGKGDGLVTSGGDLIPYSEIAVKSSNPDLDVPSLVDLASATKRIGAGTGKVIDRKASWTYTYRNSAVVAPGEYTGTMTYTAAMP